MTRYFILCLLLAGQLANAQQNDPQATAILDQVSAKNKAYKTIEAKFTIAGTNTQNNQQSTQKGTLLMKGDKYVIKLPENEIFFDGKDVYNFLPESNEVNITKPLPTQKQGDDFIISNPKEVFTLYQKDFKNKFIREANLGGKAIYEIDLYPVDLKKKYNRIRMQIDKNTSQIVSMKAFFKDGQQYTLTFDTFEVNKNLADTVFTFDKSKYPDVEIIDLRF